MANYEARDESGMAFRAWMDAMGLKAEKPQTPIFETQERYKHLTTAMLAKLRQMAGMTTVGTQNQSTREVWLENHSVKLVL